MLTVSCRHSLQVVEARRVAPKLVCRVFTRVKYPWNRLLRPDADSPYPPYPICQIQMANLCFSSSSEALFSG